MTATPYSDVNAVLETLLSNVRAILADYFVGMYLYGSLASGDFDPKHSDIDFIVITTTQLPPEVISALETMHLQFAASGSKWAAKLEGAYVPQAAIRRQEVDQIPYPTLNEGKFYLDGLGSDWIIQRHVIREHPVIVAGPDPQTLIDPVSADDIRGAVRGTLREWWGPMLDNPDWLKRTGYLAFAVVTMCRVLHAMQHGTIVSKPVAVGWAKVTLPQWAELIGWAWDQEDDTQFERLPDVLDFIRFVAQKYDIV